MNPRALARALAEGTQDPRTFGHAEHLAAAFAMLNEMPFFDACARYIEGIQGLAARVGASDKFNLTLTLAFMSVLAERMAQTPGCDFDEFLAHHPDLRARGLLERWYTPERLHSERARQTFMLPDKITAPTWQPAAAVR